MTDEEYSCCERYLRMLRMTFDPPLLITLPQEELARGGIIGRVQMEGCTTQFKSMWFSGPYAFEFSHPEPLPFKPCRGMPGFFQVAL
jgi:hypothetical protein